MRHDIRMSTSSVFSSRLKLVRRCSFVGSIKWVDKWCNRDIGFSTMPVIGLNATPAKQHVPVMHPVCQTTQAGCCCCCEPHPNTGPAKRLGNRSPLAPGALQLLR